MTDEQCRLILAWAMHEHTESRYRNMPFSWKGRQTRAALERAEVYDQESSLANILWMEMRWDPHELNWTDGQPPSDVWSFIELCSGSELSVEGRALKHCVAGYSPRCASGISATQRAGPLHESDRSTYCPWPRTANARCMTIQECACVRKTRDASTQWSDVKSFSTNSSGGYKLSQNAEDLT